MESALYRTLKRMIERGQTDGIAEKLSLFRDTGKISKDEYEELIAML